MDIKYSADKLMSLLKKYRYAALILLLGIILMVIPARSSRTNTQETGSTEPQNKTSYDITGKLTEILSNIQGVGNVQVMVSVSAGEETVYQMDEDISTNDTGSTIHKETVIITDSNRQEQALVSFVKPPCYMGVIVVCQGADQPAVKLAILDAVGKITGLGSDKISVVKMK